MTPAEHLKKAKALLEDPARWCKRSFARDEDGHTVCVDEDKAVAWCALGAIRKHMPNPYEEGSPIYAACTNILNRTMASRRVHSPIEYNDILANHWDLMAWFDRAIALAEREQEQV